MFYHEHMDNCEWLPNICSVTNNNLYYNSSVCLSVSVSTLQVAILAQSNREMSQTVRID